MHTQGLGHQLSRPLQRQGGGGVQRLEEGQACPCGMSQPLTHVFMYRGYACTHYECMFVCVSACMCLHVCRYVYVGVSGCRCVSVGVCVSV